MRSQHSYSEKKAELEFWRHFGPVSLENTVGDPALNRVDGKGLTVEVAR